METIQKVNKYYQKIIELILELYNEDLQKAIPGHCMKITGLGQNELEFLWEELTEKYPKIDTYIVKNEQDDNQRYISPTKLIELRNKQQAPLLVLIPSNSRTAAEDSYGNATFKEISLEGIEQDLKASLIRSIPEEYDAIIQNEILGYLNTYGISNTCIIKYLLALEELGYSANNIGNLIHLLNLIPDEILLLGDLCPDLAFDENRPVAPAYPSVRAARVDSAPSRGLLSLSAGYRENDVPLRCTRKRGFSLQ